MRQGEYDVEVRDAEEFLSRAASQRWRACDWHFAYSGDADHSFRFDGDHHSE
jgi:hypothetical protein